MFIVDLAGSEKSSFDQINPALQKETNFINLSLTELSNVILSLGKRKDIKFINYRNSLLTRILEPSLSDDSNIAIITTIS